MSDENLHIRQEEYHSYRTQLLDLQKSDTTEFDKGILTLSSGALGLSLAFIKDIVKIERASHPSLLMGSWFLFAGAILLTLISFLVTQKSVSVQLDYAEKYYLEEKEEYLNKKSCWVSANVWLNRFTAFLFTLAVFATVTFASINLKNVGEHMASEKTSVDTLIKAGQKGDISKGQTIPSMPKTLSEGQTIPKMTAIQPKPKPQSSGGKKGGK